MSAGRFFAPLIRGVARSAGGFRFFSRQKPQKNPPLACGSRPPCQGVKAQRGFTYLGFLLFIAVSGAGLAAYGEFASHAAQREKEAELLFRGEQYRDAIASYYKKEQRYPKALAELLEDKRYPMPVRHLRRLYREPITGQDEWGLVEAPGGGVMGVYSRSEDAPIKSGNFSLKNQEFSDSPKYADWKFVHVPPGQPARTEKAAPSIEKPAPK
jgi:type II secretory pathway pseudopilin PulG